MCYKPPRITLHDWKKIETIRDRWYKKEMKMIQEKNLSLLRKKHDRVHVEESDHELGNQLNFCFDYLFFVFIHIQ